MSCHSSAPPSPQEECIAAQPIEAELYHYVVDSQRHPESNTEAYEVALDVDGNGIADNDLGRFLGSFTTTIGLPSANPSVEASLLRGEKILLLSLRTSSRDETSCALASLRVGDSPSKAPCSDVEDLNTCGAHLDGDSSFTIASDDPRASQLLGAITEGVFSSYPALQTEVDAVVLFSFGGSIPRRLTLHHSRIRTTLTPDGIAGSIAGGVSSDDLQTIVLPAFRDALELYLSTSCKPGAEGCDCPVAAPSSITLGSLANSDCQALPIEEITQDTLIAATLNNPDLDLDNDGTDDHLSLTLPFTAVPATIR